jgi:hypothetical protein
MKENTETLLEASKSTGLEVLAEKIKCIFLCRQKNPLRIAKQR